ncbi:MAG: cell division protein FtsZ [Marinovum sp.]|jgi:cell division protein FtsZ|nr:cell division protein FtsZ [Marinovum sp.]MBT6526398.1 cell division protein FtsZ [Marinovum sp.]|tara:strand:- start:2421 stop:4046 length:1626 start_codon:yes stop_codon:yes gene_type:complete
MTLNLSMPGYDELKPRITVFGVGGAGGNAVDNMIDKNLDGVDFVVGNTDAQALQQSKSETRIQLGVKVTEGLGAGARASVGAAAAEESIEQIVDHLAGAHMCFITAGMGGGTGTGAAPIIAQAARELGVLTVGVVTKPFQFEGAKRMRQAEAGVEALQKVVDTLIIIPNQNLFRLANEKTTFTEAFSLADDVLYQGVKGVTDLMVRPGLINLDFADVRSVMDEMGKAMMGTGEAEGEDRAVSAAEKAIANPLLDEISLRGAKGVLINITGGGDLTLFELDEAANRIREEVDAEANIIVGSTLDVEMGGWMRVSVVATGIDAVEPPEELPRPRRSKPAPHDGAEPHQSEHDAPSDYHAASEPKLGRHEMRTRDEQPQYEARSTVGQSAASEEAFEAPSVDRNSEQAADPYVLEEPTFNANEEAYDSEPESFVAPRPREPGTPSPETMTRLQEAVRNAPNRLQQSMSRVDDVPADTDRSRFGINSLINRMTGQPGDSAEKPVATRRHPTSQQAEPEFEPEPEQGVDPDQDRIEIPAFLRRQAN